MYQGQPLSVNLAPPGSESAAGAHHRVVSQNLGGGLPQEAPSGFFRSVGFLHGGGGGALGSAWRRICGQSPLSSQSFRLQSRSSRRATLSFLDSLS